MMHDLIMALGLMAVIEGLVLALAPLRFEEILRVLSTLSQQQKRNIGLAVLALGVALVWVSRLF